MAKNPKRPRDPNQLGKLIVGIATGDADNIKPEPPNPHRQKGGIKGGKSRATMLTPEKRKEIAEKAAKTRWE